MSRKGLDRTQKIQNFICKIACNRGIPAQASFIPANGIRFGLRSLVFPFTPTRATITGEAGGSTENEPDIGSKSTATNRGVNPQAEMAQLNILDVRAVANLPRAPHLSEGEWGLRRCDTKNPRDAFRDVWKWAIRIMALTRFQADSVVSVVIVSQSTACRPKPSADLSAPPHTTMARYVAGGVGPIAPRARRS